MPDTAGQLDLVQFELHPGAAPVTSPPPGQRYREVARRDLDPGREPFADGHQGLPVRLPSGQPAQHEADLPTPRPRARRPRLGRALQAPDPPPPPAAPPGPEPASRAGRPSRPRTRLPRRPPLQAPNPPPAPAAPPGPEPASCPASPLQAPTVSPSAAASPTPATAGPPRTAVALGASGALLPRRKIFSQRKLPAKSSAGQISATTRSRPSQTTCRPSQTTLSAQRPPSGLPPESQLSRTHH